MPTFLPAFMILLRAAAWLIEMLLVGAAILVGVAIASHVAHAQTSPRHYMSAATNNSTLVRAGRVSVGSLSAVNSTATVYYLKLYDKVTAPTCGTDIPKLTLAVPPNTLNPNLTPDLGSGIQFFSGLGFCLVALIADNDNTSAVTGIAINFGASGF